MLGSYHEYADLRDFIDMNCGVAHNVNRVCHPNVYWGIKHIVKLSPHENTTVKAARLNLLRMSLKKCESRINCTRFPQGKYSLVDLPFTTMKIGRVRMQT